MNGESGFLEVNSDEFDSYPVFILRIFVSTFSFSRSFGYDSSGIITVTLSVHHRTSDVLLRITATYSKGYTIRNETFCPHQCNLLCKFFANCSELLSSPLRRNGINKDAESDLCSGCKGHSSLWAHSNSPLFTDTVHVADSKLKPITVYPFSDCIYILCHRIHLCELSQCHVTLLF